MVQKIPFSWKKCEKNHDICESYEALSTCDITDIHMNEMYYL